MNQPKKRTRIAICIPSGDMVHANFAISLAVLLTKTVQAGYDTCIINEKNSLLEIGRTKLVENALRLGADKILFLDSDMIFPPDALLRLLSHNVNVVCTDAMRRTAPFHTVVKKAEDNSRIDYTNCKPLEEIDGLSTGVCLIDTSIFKNMDLPFFLVDWDEKNKRFTGEDYFFGYRLKKMGYKIYCDTALSLEIGHMGHVSYTIEPGKENAKS